MKGKIPILLLLAIFLVIFQISPQIVDASSTVVLKKPMKHQNVIVLKQNLKKLGFPVPGNGTNYFGNDTEAKVKEFQSYYGLKADGVAGVETQSKINEILSTPLQYGKKHKDTKQLKSDLAALGYPVPGNGTNYYGKETRNMVKKFQKDHSLVVNGIADPVTLKKINNLMKDIPLSNGMYRKEVVDLKEKLKKLGFTVPGNGTPLFGDETEKKVREFQRYYGLIVDGKAGKETLSKLDEIVSTPFQSGKKHTDTIKLKNNLSFLGFHVSDNPTTYYGSDTKKQVEAFQKKYGLIQNGIADPVTLSKIDELLKAPLQKGLYRNDVIELKNNLKKIGFAVPGNGTNYFGKDTEAKVKEFQKYYGLTVDGVAGPATLSMISEILSSPFQKGKKHAETVQLKKDLSLLGFHISDNPTTYYGSETAKQVKAFQKKYGLVVNGIVDPVTKAKIEELLKSKKIISYTNSTYTFEQALNIQMTKGPQTDLYSSLPGYIPAKNVKVEQTAYITGDGVNLRSAPKLENNVKASVNYGTKIKIIETVTGDSTSGSNKWYKIIYNGNTLYVHSSLANPNGYIGTTTSSTNVYESMSEKSHVYGTIASNKEVTILEVGKDFHKISFQTWRNAKKEDVKKYLNPDNADEFQHLDLSGYAGSSASDLKSILSGKGVLSGKEDVFISASKKYNVNEIYLIAHALLETGNGTSELANGIYVDNNGNPYRDSSGKLITDPSKLPDSAVKVYNLFGINAVDSNPINGGAKYAFQKGWTSINKAIEGGADWISQNYINNTSHKQNTLYKMRWNPVNPGTHQYATDIGWAAKQVSRIKDLYAKLKDPVLKFDITRYK